MKYDATRYGHGEIERYGRAFSAYLRNDQTVPPATTEELARVKIKHLPTQENGVRLGVRVLGDNWVYAYSTDIQDILNMRDNHESLSDIR